MTVLGQWMVILAFFASAGSVVSYVLKARGKELGPNIPAIFVVLSTIFIVLASVCLVALLLLHDYSNGYVFSYSDRSLPLHFLISAFYAGQEGSFLFWTLCSSILALFLRSVSSKRGNESYVMTVFMVLQTAMIGLVLAKSPFRMIWEMFPGAPVGQLPVDGRGLNPLLQNLWMVIHPPVLFLGFAGMAVPFSLAVAGLWKSDFSILPRQALSWLLFSTSVLGLGIMLGAYWAYGVLGWGGYWGWDPVENSSLVPWITAVALLHTLLAQLRTGKYVRLNMSVALITFFLVMYSTFLTRSGILGDASVHSFTDPGATIYWMLQGVLAGIGATSIGLLTLRWRAMNPGNTDVQWLTRESLLGAGATVLLLSAAVIFFGTSLPIFSTTRVESAFYDTTNLPIAVAIVLLIGLSLYSQWEFQDGKDLMRRSMRAIALSVIAGVVLFLLGVRDIPHLGLAISSIFALLVNAEIIVRVVKGDWRFLGGKIAHIGIALFLIGVLSTGRYATTERMVLIMNRPQTALGGTFTFMGAHLRGDGKTAFSVAVSRPGESVVLEPVMFDAGQQGIMKNPAIASTLTHDLYVSPLSFEEPSLPADEYTLIKGQTVEIQGAQATFLSFEVEGQHGAMRQQADGSIRVSAALDIVRGKEHETIRPLAVMRSDKGNEYAEVSSQLLGTQFRLVGINIENQSGPMIRLSVTRRDLSAAPGVLMLEASVKPFVLLLWVGTVVMLAGFALAIMKHLKEGVR